MALRDIHSASSAMTERRERAFSEDRQVHRRISHLRLKAGSVRRPCVAALRMMRSWKVLGGSRDEFCVCDRCLSLGCNIGLCHAIGCGICLRPPPDAGGDRFLGGGMFLPVALGRGLNRVGGLESLDLLGQFGNARPFLFAWLLGRTGKAGLELVT